MLIPAISTGQRFLDRNYFLMLKYDDPELCGENDKRISSISKISYSLLYVLILPLSLLAGLATLRQPCCRCHAIYKEIQ